MRLTAILIFTVFAAVSAELTPEDQEYIEAYRNECMQETGADKDLILKASNGDIADDPKLREHILCVFKNAGFVDSSGKAQNDQILLDLTITLKDSKLAKSVVNECVKDRGTPQISAAENYKCFYQKTGLPLL